MTSHTGVGWLAKIEECIRNSMQQEGKNQGKVLRSGAVQKMMVTERKIIRLIGHARRANIRNEVTHDKVGAAPLEGKM